MAIQVRCSIVRPATRPTALAAIAAVTLAALPAWAADAPPAAITVAGEASADVVPDTAIVSLGVEVERPSAGAATAEAAALSQSMMAALRTEGIADADVMTTAITLDPIYPETINGQVGRARGFRAATRVRVTIKPATRAGAIASDLVDKGANAIDGIDYAASDEPRRLDDLRAAAMRDALHKAQVYCGALNLHLGRVLEITPLSSGLRASAPIARSASILAAKTALPSAPGVVTLQADVTVRWALDP